MAKANINNKSRDSQPTEKGCLPFSGPQEFPIGWRVHFPSHCQLWGKQWTTHPAGPDGTTPGALSSSSDCGFPHARRRVGSRSVGSSKPSYWRAALPSIPPASGSQLRLGLGWLSLSLTPPPTLLWALVHLPSLPRALGCVDAPVLSVGPASVLILLSRSKRAKKIPMASSLSVGF